MDKVARYQSTHAPVIAPIRRAIISPPRQTELARFCEAGLIPNRGREVDQVGKFKNR